MPTVLVIGAAGALGRAVAGRFLSASWSVLAIDKYPVETSGIRQVPVAPALFAQPLSELGPSIEKAVGGSIDGKLDAILTVAGGWAGGSLKSADLYANTELMIAQSVNSSVIATRLASLYLKEGGLVTLTGASAATHGTPGMIAYGLAKAAVHQLVKSVAGPNSGLPPSARVLAILPITLDTPANRAAMPDADTSTWTPLATVADRLFEWATDKSPVESGSLLRISTENNKTEFVPVI